ncbi:MAG: hypothetical protein M1144_02070 [Candidatus Thermoplasmatota archaeon]|jgi:hypothetical protein|nr:hypothetical protein [Candidatus Thermoplasmatota archaeon]
MAAQPMMVAGPVEYKRQYSLIILVVLIIVCWPAAIIYYFTRPKVPVQQLGTYQPVAAQPAYYQPAPAQGQYTAPPVAAAPAPAAAPAQAPAAGGVPTCKTCGKPATFVAQYNRYYCYNCKQYV